MENPNLLFYLFCLILAIVVWALIPGLNQGIRPAIGLISQTIKLSCVVAFSWLVFATKAVFRSHLEVIENLSKSAEEVDPSLAVYKGPERIGEKSEL